MNQPFSAPQDFTNKFPRYVYRSGKGASTVQWRQAAMDMANDRAKLVEALQTCLKLWVPTQGKTRDEVEELLRDLGEIK